MSDTMLDFLYNNTETEERDDWHKIFHNKYIHPDTEYEVSSINTKNQQTLLYYDLNR